MAFLEKIEFVSLPDVRIIGREVPCSLRPDAKNPVPALWEASFTDGTIDMLKKLPLVVPGCTIGWMGDVQGQDYRYIAGVIAQPDTPVPQGMQFRNLSACDVAKGYIHGNLLNSDVYVSAHTLTLEGIAANQRQEDYSFGWGAEIYPDWLSFEAEEGTFCYYQPCKKVVMFI
jgi:predicted transcriptional regulator YdeE